MLSTNEKGPTSPQVNRRVATSNYQTYEEAAKAKKEALATGEYSKVKVIARPAGNFNLACYVPLEKDNA